MAQSDLRGAISAHENQDSHDPTGYRYYYYFAAAAAATTTTTTTTRIFILQQQSPPAHNLCCSYCSYSITSPQINTW